MIGVTHFVWRFSWYDLSGFPSVASAETYSNKKLELPNFQVSQTKSQTQCRQTLKHNFDISRPHPTALILSSNPHPFAEPGQKIIVALL